MSYKVERITADAAPESPVDIKFFFISLFLHSAMEVVLYTNNSNSYGGPCL